MAAQPASTVSTISPAEMQILISRAGLVLNPGQMADLVLAWRQVAGLIASIPQDRRLADDMALTFRLPPPTAASAVARTPQGMAAKRAGKAAAPPRPTAATAKPAAKPIRKGQAAAKAKPKSKAPARRRASRGR